MNNNKKLLSAVNYTNILLFFVIALLTIPFADDFFRFTYSHKYGPIGLAIKRYLEWDGREIAITSIIRDITYYLFYSHPRVPNLINAIFFSFSGYFLGLYLINKFKLKIESSSYKLIFYFLITLIVWFSIYPMVGEIIYWSSIYKYVILVTFMFIYIYEVRFKSIDNQDSLKLIDKLFFIGVSYLFGNLGLILIGVFFSYFIFILYEQLFVYKREKLKEFILYIFIPVAIGFIITILSPVYYKKVGLATKSNSINLYQILIGFGRLTDLLKYMKWYPFFSSFLLFLLVKAFNNDFFNKKEHIYNIFKWLLIGLTGIYIFMPIYNVLSARHTFILTIFLNLSLLNLYFLIFRKLKLPDKDLIVLILSLFFTIILAKDLTTLYIFNETQYKPRIDQINAYRYHHAKVCRFALYLYPYSTRDIHLEKNYWINGEVAMYYKLKSIVLDKNCTYDKIYRGHWYYRFFFGTKIKCFLEYKNILNDKNDKNDKK